jgi:ribonuclease P protein subunit POP4
MNITPDIIRSEFVGMCARISRSSHRGNIGISGKILDETRNTFKILDERRTKTIVKSDNVFHFKFHDGTVVEVDGKILVGRPEDRLKKIIRRMW